MLTLAVVIMSFYTTVCTVELSLPAGSPLLPVRWTRMTPIGVYETLSIEDI